jgi:VanZ family protein
MAPSAISAGDPFDPSCDRTPDSAPVLAGIPLAFVVALLASPRVAARLDIGRATAFLLVLGIAGVLAITLLPQPFARRPPADLSCLIPEIAFPAQGRLLAINDESLNVLLFVPLGIALGLLVGHPRFPMLLAIAITLPWVVEAIQLAIPALGRACQSADLTANLFGLLIGVAIAFVVRVTRRLLSRSR